MKIATGTIVRTLILTLALLNQVLVSIGKSPLPIENEELEMFITLGINIVVSIIAFWKNNSFTSRAIEADAYMNINKEFDKQNKCV